MDINKKEDTWRIIVLNFMLVSAKYQHESAMLLLLLGRFSRVRLCVTP